MINGPVQQHYTSKFKYLQFTYFATSIIDIRYYTMRLYALFKL